MLVKISFLNIFHSHHDLFNRDDYDNNNLIDIKRRKIKV